MDTITGIDFAILDFLQERLSCEALNTLMPIITYLGSAGAIWIITAAILLIFRGYRRNGVMMCVGLLLCFIIGNLLLKNLVARDRPCWINESVELLVSVPKDYSFPSGHSMVAFASTVILLHTDKRFGIPALILACLIAFSRLYLYVHFPTDVAAGTLIGCGIGIAVCVAGDRILKPRSTL
ncbi:MAG: phosphatase PAP2 family protein [Oscillospiraceae bacterium]|nr:phosphatase PAP2 family protein [Oscillospiraceae bacterium]